MIPIPSVLSTAELRRLGHGKRSLRTAVASGDLLHVRRDNYLPRGAPPEIVEAVRIGGRLTCLSLLALLGVFVRRLDGLHVQMEGNAARLRAPHGPARLHWRRAIDGTGRSASTASIVDALAHSVLCQRPRDAIATLDSALHLGIATLDDIAAVFAGLPAKYGALRPLIDGRAESGPETLLRLALRQLGCRVELQVRIDGVGRVDLVVDGWLVIECDSREFHSSWAAQQTDRSRDLALAARGFTCLRPTANDIMQRLDTVIAAVAGLRADRATRHP